jgi:hypothetical protein
MAKMVAAVIVCVLVLALDITAGILGLQAQAAQNKVLLHNIDKIFSCFLHEMYYFEIKVGLN